MNTLSRAALLAGVEFKKVRVIRTQEGARRYGKPIGSIIGGNGEHHEHLTMGPGVFKGFETVTGKDGQKYDVGFDKDTGKWVATLHNSWHDVTAGGSEDEVYRNLNAHVGNKVAPKKKPAVPKPSKKAPAKASEPAAAPVKPTVPTPGKGGPSRARQETRNGLKLAPKKQPDVVGRVIAGIPKMSPKDIAQLRQHAERTGNTAVLDAIQRHEGSKRKLTPRQAAAQKLNDQLREAGSDNKPVGDMTHDELVAEARSIATHLAGRPKGRSIGVQGRLRDLNHEINYRKRITLAPKGGTSTGPAPYEVLSKNSKSKTAKLRYKDHTYTVQRRGGGLSGWDITDEHGNVTKSNDGISSVRGATRGARESEAALRSGLENAHATRTVRQEVLSPEATAAADTAKARRQIQKDVQSGRLVRTKPGKLQIGDVVVHPQSGKNVTVGSIVYAGTGRRTGMVAHTHNAYSLYDPEGHEITALSPNNYIHVDSTQRRQQVDINAAQDALMVRGNSRQAAHRERNKTQARLNELRDSGAITQEQHRKRVEQLDEIHANELARIEGSTIGDLRNHGTEPRALISHREGIEIAHAPKERNPSVYENVVAAERNAAVKKRKQSQTLGYMPRNIRDMDRYTNLTEGRARLDPLAVRNRAQAHHDIGKTPAVAWNAALTDFEQAGRGFSMKPVTKPDTTPAPPLTGAERARHREYAVVLRGERGNPSAGDAKLTTGSLKEQAHNGVEFLRRMQNSPGTNPNSQAYLDNAANIRRMANHYGRGNEALGNHLHRVASMYENHEINDSQASRLIQGHITRLAKKRGTKSLQFKAPVITPGGRVGDDAKLGSRANGTNWVERTAPGNTGSLPSYIRIVRNALIKHGHSESSATAIAVATMKRWARGGGDVSAKVRAAAAAALAQWEAMKAKAKGKRVVGAVAHAAKSDSETTEMKKLPRTQKCSMCDKQATKRVLWAEGHGYQPACDDHLQDVKDKLNAQDEVVGVHDIAEYNRRQDRKKLKKRSSAIARTRASL